jgi:hypothetical protein
MGAARMKRGSPPIRSRVDCDYLLRDRKASSASSCSQSTTIRPRSRSASGRRWKTRVSDAPPAEERCRDIIGRIPQPGAMAAVLVLTVERRHPSADAGKMAMPASNSTPFPSSFPKPLSAGCRPVRPLCPPARLILPGYGSRYSSNFRTRELRSTPVETVSCRYNSGRRAWIHMRPVLRGSKSPHRSATTMSSAGSRVSLRMRP